MSDGIVLVDKEQGWTSHDVVAKMRGIAGTRKVGHAGTLDPMATGVLVLGIGRATRLLGHLSGADKEYEATIVLGAATNTDDAEGETIATAPAGHLDRAEVERALAAYRGPILQVPSSVSAIKINGERAYKRVRDGQEVDLPPRPVHIARFDLLDFRTAGDTVEVDAVVVCSSGTYIRALARDLGADLEVGGHLSALRRTRSGGFSIDGARTLDAHRESLSLLPIADAAAQSFRVVTLDEERAVLVRYGRQIDVSPLGDAFEEVPVAEPVALFAPDGEFLALHRQEGALLRPLAVFVS